MADMKYLFKNVEWNQVKKDFYMAGGESPEDEYIKNLCNLFGLSCQISNGVIFVKTNIATWRIYYNGKKVLKVYHENYRIRRDQFRKRMKCNEGYHKQEIKDKTLYGVLRYIQSHDKYLYSPKKIRKSRVEKLFDKIEHEKRSKNDERNMWNKEEN